MKHQDIINFFNKDSEIAMNIANLVIKLFDMNLLQVEQREVGELLLYYYRMALREEDEIHKLVKKVEKLEFVLKSNDIGLPYKE